MGQFLPVRNELSAITPLRTGQKLRNSLSLLCKASFGSSKNSPGHLQSRSRCIICVIPLDALIAAIRRYSWLGDSPHPIIFFPGWTSTSIQKVLISYDLILICRCRFSHRMDRAQLSQSFRNKAVAEGAISYILDHSVTSRVSRYTYGIKSSTTFHPHNPEHVARMHTCCIDASGRVLVSGRFSAILEKVMSYLLSLS